MGKSQILWSMTTVPKGWFALMRVVKGRLVSIFATSPTLQDVLNVLEQHKGDPNFMQEVKVFRHGKSGLRLWKMPGERFTIRELSR